VYSINMTIASTTYYERVPVVLWYCCCSFFLFLFFFLCLLVSTLTPLENRFLVFALSWHGTWCAVQLYYQGLGAFPLFMNMESAKVPMPLQTGEFLKNDVMTVFPPSVFRQEAVCHIVWASWRRGGWWLVGLEEAADDATAIFLCFFPFPP
jgi:hypothetical protein